MDGYLSKYGCLFSKTWTSILTLRMNQKEKVKRCCKKCQKRFISSPEWIDVIVSLVFGDRLLLLVRRALVGVHDVGDLVEAWDLFNKIA